MPESADDPFDRHRRRSARPRSRDSHGRSVRAGVSRASVCIPSMRRRSRRQDYDRLADAAAHPKVLLVGEIGLDYYWKPYDAKLQADVFVAADADRGGCAGSRSASTRETRGTIRSRCFDALGADRAALHHALLHRQSGAGQAGAGSRILSQLLRCRDLPEGNRRSRFGASLLRWIASWWRRTLRTLRRFRFAASATSHHTWFIRRNALRNFEG